MHKSEDDTKVNIKIRPEDEVRIKLPYDREQWWTPTNKTMNVRISQQEKYFLTNGGCN